MRRRSTLAGIVVLASLTIGGCGTGDEVGHASSSAVPVTSSETAPTSATAAESSSSTETSTTAPPPASSTGAATSPSSSAPTSPAPSAPNPAARRPDPRWDKNPVTLTFTGDVMLAEAVSERMQAEGPQAAFGPLTPLLRAADIAVVNLENALGTAADAGQPQPKGFTFMAAPGNARALTDAGVDVANLANNHTYDFGAPGIRSTLRAVDAVKVPRVGLGMDGPEAHRPVIIQRKGMKIAFLGYTAVGSEGAFLNSSWAAGPGKPGVAWVDPAAITADVKAVRPKVDHVIVMIHAGNQYTSKVTDNQHVGATAARAAGATAVIGHHPHVNGGYDWNRKDGSLVAWSLGNTVFYQMANTPSNSGAVLTVQLTGRGIQKMSWTPIMIDRHSRTHVLDPRSGQGAAILKMIEAAPKKR